MVILPMYNRFDDTWRIDNEDGTFSTVTNEEYQKLYSPYKDMFKTRYDKLSEESD